MRNLIKGKNRVEQDEDGVTKVVTRQDRRTFGIVARVKKYQRR